jgi:uridine kinase
VLTGPSGCGKTHVATASGLPVLASDDFYRTDADPAMPRRDDGHPDWEDPRSCDTDALLAATVALCDQGRVEVPTYSFGREGPARTRTIERHGQPYVVVEGLFAAEIIPALRERGLLADALMIAEDRPTTFFRRLRRDVIERRKPLGWTLIMDVAKARSEPEVLAHERALGARPVSIEAATARLAELGGAAAERRP